MGMFDSVICSCPKCKADVEIQSKAGKCHLDTFHGEAPTIIAGDINGEKVTCSACQTELVVRSGAPRMVQVWLSVPPSNPDDNWIEPN